jgi:hypothetical protein
MAANRWKDPSYPKDGWACVDVMDLGEATHECEMCGGERVRYVHVMHHPEAGTCEAGCVCAGRMTGDLEAANAREQSLKNKAGRRSRWLTRKWKVSGKGNEFLSLDGFNMTVFPNKWKPGKWSWSFDGKFSKEAYASSEEAKLALFEVYNQTLDTGSFVEAPAPTTQDPAPVGAAATGSAAAAGKPETAREEPTRHASNTAAPTGEQALIAQSKSRLLRVEAFAGTGKTTTLVEYAKARPQERMLYLAFNKAIQMEAERRFPKNVECRTTHSLAWKFGKPYNEVGKLGENRPLDVSRDLGVKPTLAGLILDTVNNYLCSADNELGSDHIPDDPRINVKEYDNILNGAKLLWARMRDLEYSGIRLPHDGYLKLYQLSKPVLGYDTILFDEAQDANPATTDIVLRQECGKVFVGDTHQQIYSFRGADNALKKLPAEETLYLTQSFRFGRGVAGLANLLLTEFKGETNTLKGLGRHGTTLFSVDCDKQYAFIARTNSAVFDEAVSMLDGDKKLHFVGGPAGYRFDRILDAYNLFVGEKHRIRDPYYRKFECFTEMEKFGEDTDDKELKMLCRVIRKYEHDIPSLIDRLTARHNPDMARADVLFCTAHKSKGLEFDQVVLANDYSELLNEDGKQCGPGEIELEEINILYVASTRAKAALQPCQQVCEWLDKAGYSLEALNAVRDDEEEDPSAKKPRLKAA